MIEEIFKKMWTKKNKSESASAIPLNEFLKTTDRLKNKKKSKLLEDMEM